MAQQLARKRTALGLYALLLVLPAFVLGGLNWRQLQQEQALELNEVPDRARTGTHRLLEGIRRSLDNLLAEEGERYFTDYQERVFPEKLIGTDLASVPSPLVQKDPPRGVLAWFAWDFRQVNQFTMEEFEAGIPEDKLQFSIFRGQHHGWEEWPKQREGLVKTVTGVMLQDWHDGLPVRVTRYEKVARNYDVPLSHAVVNLTKERDFDCLKSEAPALRAFAETFVEVYQYDFHLRFFLEPDGSPKLMATRLILVDDTKQLEQMPDCYSNLKNGASIVQGFFIDTQWLFGEVPDEVAQQVLREGEIFHPIGSESLTTSDDLLVSKIHLVDALDFETYKPEDRTYGELQISIDRVLRPRHLRQSRSFLMLAAMLLFSLGIGMVLLLRSVKRDLDQARRTENFVASVTHELRTPVSAIRLYGEMLRDGWAASEEKQQEYYGRIVQESYRLETMVERVLEKSQVSSREAKPQAEDLNAFVKAVAQRELKLGADLGLDLQADLPPALIITEGLRSIVINLVENARKYAPAKDRPGGDGKIWIRTRVEGNRILLEVLDRGPGIPDEDKVMVFEAFYRRGDESTRRSKGTGLGLHLVKIQAQSMGGDVTILDRPGGGCTFRVRLLPAPLEE